MKVSYEFCAFPAVYWPQERNRPNKGWRLGCWSTFTFATLSEARAEIRRLARAYVASGAFRLEGIARSVGIFEITRVTREKVFQEATKVRRRGRRA